MRPSVHYVAPLKPWWRPISGNHALNTTFAATASPLPHVFSTPLLICKYHGTSPALTDGAASLLYTAAGRRGRMALRWMRYEKLLVWCRTASVLNRCLSQHLCPASVPGRLPWVTACPPQQQCWYGLQCLRCGLTVLRVCVLPPPPHIEADSGGNRPMRAPHNVQAVHLPGLLQGSRPLAVCSPPARGPSQQCARCMQGSKHDCC
jgi:hypothetical protein